MTRSNTPPPETAAAVCSAARVVLNYHTLRHPLAPADCIFGFGTNDDRVAERAADLFLAGFAPRLLFSGGVSSWTKGLYQTSEAQHFAGIARAKGVPEEHLLIEPAAANTGENVMFSKRLLQERGISVQKIIIVQKPYMERRCFATCRKLWPEVDAQTASPLLTFEELPLPHLPMDEVINIMVGDLDRIRVYPELGYQVPQEIPAAVLKAFEELVRLGYDKHLIRR